MRDDGLAVVEVKKTVQDQFNADIDQRLARMPVRADICKRYYLDAAGRNHIIWPEYGFVIKHRLSHFKAADYELMYGRSAQAGNVKPIVRQSTKSALSEA